MSLDTVKRITELLRAARTEGACNDPDYFDQKAATWEAIAVDDERMAPEANRFAEEARARARALRLGSAP